MSFDHISIYFSFRLTCRYIFFFIKENPTGFVEAQFQILCLVGFFLLLLLRNGLWKLKNKV